MLNGMILSKDPLVITGDFDFHVHDCLEKDAAKSNYLLHGPLTRYVKLQVAHAPGMPGTFFPPPPISKETDSWRSRHASRHVRDARAVMHVGIAYLRWQGKRSRHSRRMHTRNFAYLARGPWNWTTRACLYIPTPRDGYTLDLLVTRTREWVIEFNGLSWTADSGVHVVHISRVITWTSDNTTPNKPVASSYISNHTFVLEHPTATHRHKENHVIYFTGVTKTTMTLVSVWLCYHLLSRRGDIWWRGSHGLVHEQVAYWHNWRLCTNKTKTCLTRISSQHERTGTQSDVPRKYSSQQISQVWGAILARKTPPTESSSIPAHAIP